MAKKNFNTALGKLKEKQAERKAKKPKPKAKGYQPKTNTLEYVDKFKQSPQEGEVRIQQTDKQKQYGGLQARQPRFKTPEELELVVDEYFEKGAMVNIAGKFDDKGNPVQMPVYTMSGLALFLGYKSRRSLMEYEKKDEFAHIIQTAVLRVEAAYETKLHGTNPSGAIFALKNVRNRWSDSVKSEVNVKIDPFLGIMQAKKKKDE